MARLRAALRVETSCGRTACSWSEETQQLREARRGADLLYLLQVGRHKLTKASHQILEDLEAFEFGLRLNTLLCFCYFYALFRKRR
jgi:hypothetical protein